MSMTTVHINGKWLAQPLTGTQRYAAAMVDEIMSMNRLELVVHLPSGVGVPESMVRPGVRIRRAPVGGIFFEQLYLPVVTAGQLLLNFAGPAPLLKRRQLVTMHDATLFRYPSTFSWAFVAFYALMYWLLGRTARQLLTVSRFSATELATVLRIPVSRFIVAGCAADALSSIAPSRPELDVDGEQYLVVATRARHKNLLTPLMAVAQSGRNVVVVGGGGGDQVFAVTSSLDEHATLAGRLRDEELVWLYRNSRALIFPSKYEGFGLPPLEAQTLGCPVVCSTAAALPEVCGDGAIYFDPDDPQTLLAALDRLESEPGLADTMRSLGQANSRQFAWAVSAGKVVDWIESGSTADREQVSMRGAHARR
jgi:glycosyltransferase involved in cell wall biosynthesis